MTSNYIMSSMKRRGKPPRMRIPPVPLGLRRKTRYTFREIDEWLRSLGAKPLSRKTKQVLMASGNWGMPEE